MWNLISDLIALKENSVKFFLSRIWLFDALKIRQEIIPKRLLNKGTKKTRLKFNLGLALNGLRTTGPRAIASSYPWIFASSLQVTTPNPPLPPFPPPPPPPPFFLPKRFHQDFISLTKWVNCSHVYSWVERGTVGKKGFPKNTKCRPGLGMTFECIQWNSFTPKIKYNFSELCSIHFLQF